MQQVLWHSADCHSYNFEVNYQQKQNKHGILDLKSKTMADLLETTLSMLDLQKYTKSFKSYGIDSSILPLLSDDDLKLIGIEEEHLRKRFIQQCLNLPVLNEVRYDMSVDTEYISKVLKDLDHHLLLLNASLSYAYFNKNIKRSNVKLSRSTNCLVNCVGLLQNKLETFQNLFDPISKNAEHNWENTALIVIATTAAAYTIKCLFNL